MTDARSRLADFTEEASRTAHGSHAAAHTARSDSNGAWRARIPLDMVALQRGTYLYGGFECAFRRKPASPGFEGKPPLLLVHPLGIGLASWFYEPFLEQWTGSEVWVPDLIGCGASDAWVPEQRTLTVPQDWVRSLEALWRDEIRRPMVVVSQGGLAPLAISLAARETATFQGRRAVRGLVLASPPEWHTISAGLSEEEVERNFGLLGATLGSASGVGTLGYRALCGSP